MAYSSSLLTPSARISAQQCAVTLYAVFIAKPQSSSSRRISSGATSGFSLV